MQECQERQTKALYIEWLESKDCGKRDQVNVKHIIGRLEEVTVGSELVIKLNLQRYCTKVVDLLEWTPP